MVRLYNDVWSGTSPPPLSWSRSIITTLYKGGSLLMDQVSSRRPISLLDTDYKIFAKIIAARLQLILQKLILHSQNGLVKGRSIFANILALQQAIKNIENGNFSFPQVLLVDCEKAFDRVSHLAIRLIFQHLGCPAIQLRVLMTIR